jgi:putative salt-induced outer membrane protein YdiY
MGRTHFLDRSMQNSPIKFLGTCAALLVAGTSLLRADLVETKSGARLVGIVTKVDAGAVTLVTDYAGTISIKQSEVARLETSQPLFIRLAGGTTMAGTVEAVGDGKIAIKGQDGTITTTVDKLATTWAPGATDPAVAALQRSWKYEADFALAGKTGNSEQLSYGGGAKATLAGPTDTLKFYGAFKYDSTEGTKTDDKVALGVDYANNFSGRTSWYVRNEGGYDQAKDIDFYNVAASGLGYDFIQNKPVQMLTGRAGLAYRFENYGSVLTEDVQSAGLDFGLAHFYKFPRALLVNSLSYVPSIEDFSNYHAVHDSSLQMPLAGKWDLRIGVSNDYNSVPGAGVKKMDTTYYTKFVLSWE